MIGRKPVERDLLGPVPKRIPRRTVAPHPQRCGFTIAVREAGSHAARYVGFYPTEGEAWQAVRDGVGKTHEDRETMQLSVYRRQ